MPDVNTCHEENFVEGLAAGLLAMKVRSRVVCQLSVVFDGEQVAHGKKSTPTNNNIWIISLTDFDTQTHDTPAILDCSHATPIAKTYYLAVG